MANQKKMLEAERAVLEKREALILAHADRDGGLTDEARAEVEGIQAKLARIADDTAFHAQFEKVTGGSTRSASSRFESLGTQFVQSPVYTWLRESTHTRGTAWTSPSAELMAATLTEDGASGGDLVVPDYRPGIVTPFPRPLVVADLLAPGTTNGGSLTYMKEDSFTNAAATVAEGASKPESTLTFSAVQEPARKIATFLPVSEEILEDVAQMRSYVDARLRLGVQMTEDDQLLNGDGVAPNFLGLMNRSGLATTVARGSDTNADAIAKQISAIATSANLQPDGIVLHPTNWLTMLLMKDSEGAYYGDGPFSSMQRPMLWGVPVALTTAITLGTALVGAFKPSAQFLRKGGIRVEASNSHSDYFVKNLVAIRAEERGILAVYRPGAIGKVTGLL